MLVESNLSIEFHGKKNSYAVVSCRSLYKARRLGFKSTELPGSEKLPHACKRGRPDYSSLSNPANPKLDARLFYAY